MKTKGINGGAFRGFGRMIYVIRVEGKYQVAISVINVEKVGLTHYKGIKPREGLILLLTCVREASVNECPVCHCTSHTG